jgi:hypothetical protein
MTTIAEVRTGLAEAVSNASWDGNPLSCSAYPTDVFDPPGAFVTRLPFDPRMVLGSSNNVATFRVWIGVLAVDPEAGGIVLDALCDPLDADGVTQAVQDGTNWTSVTVDYAQVVEIGEVIEARTATDGRYFAVSIDVEVCW